MRAHALLATDRAAGSRSRSRVTEMRGQAPLLLRLVEPGIPEPFAANAADAARVSVAAGAAGPIGGDQYRFDVVVGARSTLVLTEVSATLLLPGPYGAQSKMSTRVRVQDGATLIWLAQPVIAAKDCHHVNDIRVELAAGARLLMREQLVLGRHGEPPGRLIQRVRVQRDHRPLYHQELAIGDDGSGFDGPAVAHHYRALGSMLVVDPDWVDAGPATRPLDATTALLRLDAPAVVVSAVADDTVALTRALQAGLAIIGSPWDLKQAGGLGF
jgi:urease accessory protein